ncbi:MAG: hypothetical protein K0R38_7929, partial [Polyangiaceae bacterium]|nr:hypothetical protein [Polyangiaceae bacterium]
TWREGVLDPFHRALRFHVTVFTGSGPLLDAVAVLGE